MIRLASIAAIAVSLFLTSTADADVVCGGPNVAYPPGTELHCRYTGNDRSPTYLHLGNAEWYIADGFENYSYNWFQRYCDPANNGTLAGFWAGTIWYERISSREVRVHIRRFDPWYRLAASFNGHLRGTDRQPGASWATAVSYCWNY